MTTIAAGPCFDTAREVADAVLYEGYVLYPYRASSAKNRMRWQFGVLVPPAYGLDVGEHAWHRTECLAEPRADAELVAQVRFLHTQRRTVQSAGPHRSFRTVDRLELPDRVLVPWDEGVEEAVEFRVPIAELCAAHNKAVAFPFRRPATEETEDVRDEAGQLVGRLVRRRAQVDGVLRLWAVELPGPCRVVRLRAVVENTGEWCPGLGRAADREAALPHALVSAHLLLGLTAGSFVSMTDPPEWAAPAVKECRNERTWPVLAGVDGRADVVLSSPIILEDHPRIAPESCGTLYDATEIDEILALRTAALTDQEKREARGTDDRAAAVVDLADSLPPEIWERLHGAVRSLREVTDGPPVLVTPGEEDAALADLMTPQLPWWDPAVDASVDPGTDRVLVDGTPVGAGSRVRLRPGRRRTDAQDLFLQDAPALVEAVIQDVDGVVHLAVTLDDDPGADLRRAQGRFLYFQPDEVVPVEAR
ncbi:hypothetical protein DN069_02180 [Streptacidiphilus pinicola]|uniref:Uncharacterized protein n=1 Tax=Streptacidiphilus pinicola TaxID=2219663 RepID=A0A2X0JAS0_9ACTN|nr:hypothetical protein [Streptacidiphilus pinicola]RAG87346.1 hypothetical protein DN069_02180 [Streptacidiphilus pinicola]